MPGQIGAIYSKEGHIDLEGPIKAARRAVKKKFPVEKSLAELLLEVPEPRLRPIEEILKAVSGDTLQLDRVFYMDEALQSWEAAKAANIAASEAVLALLDADIKAIVDEAEAKLNELVK